MKSILIVDDENLILYSLSTTFRHDGYDVTTAANAAAAMQELKIRNFEICFFDVNLPDGNGLDLMNIAREKAPGTCIVIMTALDLSGPQLASMRACGCHYLSKPFDLEHVRTLVSDIENTGPSAARQAKTA